MSCGKAALVAVVSLLACPVAVADSTSASASGSVRITLRLPAVSEWRSPEAGRPGRQFCVRHVPARHYSVLVGSGSVGKNRDGMAGGCIPIPRTGQPAPASGQGGGVLTVTVAAE